VAQRQENRHYLLWLALGTVCIALVMAGLLALQLTQSRAIRKSVELQADSVTALTFQLERAADALGQRLQVDVVAHGAPPCRVSKTF
jgi:hypothetical protein